MRHRRQLSSIRHRAPVSPPLKDLRLDKALESLANKQTLYEVEAVAKKLVDEANRLARRFRRGFPYGPYIKSLQAIRTLLTMKRRPYGIDDKSFQSLRPLFVRFVEQGWLNKSILDEFKSPKAQPSSR